MIVKVTIDCFEYVESTVRYIEEGGYYSKHCQCEGDSMNGRCEKAETRTEHPSQSPTAETLSPVVVIHAPTHAVVTPAPTPVPAPPSDFELYAADGEGRGICTTGKALTQEECFVAANEVGIGMNLRDSLNVGSWNFTPCGCFIYIYHWVDYKDPQHGNCKPDSNSKLVCRKQKFDSSSSSIYFTNKCSCIQQPPGIPGGGGARFFGGRAFIILPI